jgi:hypothetical protein
MTHRRFYQQPFVIPLATAAAAITVALTVGTGWGQIGEKISDNTARIERVEQRVVAELAAINRKLDMLFLPRLRQ